MLRAIPSSIPVLITGASSGLGEEFARQFAERGHDLTVVARRIDRLEALATDLHKRFKVDVTPLGADLSTMTGRTPVLELLAKEGPWILINNAGFGTRGRFSSLDPDREHEEVSLNVLAVHQLTQALLPTCVDVGEGGVINLASTAAFQPLPYMATYAATKAFVLHFTEALAVELHGTGVRVQALCPGPTRTEFIEVAGATELMFMARTMSAEKVIRSSLRAFDRNHTVCIPGALNATLAQGPRLAPRALVRRMVAPLFSPRKPTTD